MALKGGVPCWSSHFGNHKEGQFVHPEAPRDWVGVPFEGATSGIKKKVSVYILTYQGLLPELLCLVFERNHQEKHGFPFSVRLPASPAALE